MSLKRKAALALQMQDLGMTDKVSLMYEIYGSASGGENGYWRWQVISPVSKKVLRVGSVYGPLVEAQRHAREALARLNARFKEDPSPAFSSLSKNFSTINKDSYR